MGIPRGILSRILEDSCHLLCNSLGLTLNTAKDSIAGSYAIWGSFIVLAERIEKDRWIVLLRLRFYRNSVNEARLGEI